MQDSRTVDMVNHPPHYIFKNGIETIDVIEAFTEDLTGAEAVNTAHVIRYMSRWKKKNGLQDLKKAQFYINRLIEQVEKREFKARNEAMTTATTVSSTNSDLDEIVKIFNT